VKKWLLLLALLGTLYADGCWEDDETMDMAMAENEGTLIFSFKDAAECTPLSGAGVAFGNVTLTTDESGYVRVPLGVLASLEEGTYIPLGFSKQGYIPLKTEVVYAAGSIWQTKFLISKKMAPDSVRFVLSWGDEPRDLDLHLKARGYHISFRNKRSIDGVAKLDRDAMRGFGAETITLERVDASEHYTLFVKRFSLSGKMDARGKVFVYVNNELERVVTLPETDKPVVKVLELSASGITANPVAMDREP